MAKITIELTLQQLKFLSMSISDYMRSDLPKTDEALAFALRLRTKLNALIREAKS